MMSLSAFLRSTFPQYGSFRVASRGVSSFGTIRKIPFGSNRGTVSSPVRFTNLSGASTRGDLRSQFGSTSSSLVPVLLSLRAGSNGTNGQFRLRSSRSESGHPAEREKPESSDFNNSSAPIDWNHALNLIIKAKANLANQVETASPMVSTQFPELKDLAIQLSEHFARGGKIPMNIMNAILDVSILRHETLPNVIPIFRSVCNTTTGERGSVIVVGDTHGQYLDFYQIIQDQLAGTPSDNNRFVINGDIVDRGTMSIEILTVLLTLKLACDSSVTILRGNHETTMMNKHYGFEKEVLFKFERNRDILAKFRLLFDTLPLAAVIENSLFVVHGGLGQQTANMTISDLNKLDRQTDANEDTISELLWGDPKEGFNGFRHNHARGGGTVFGPDISAHFLDKNNLDMMVRSHEVRMQGFDVMHDNRVITIFSAPNYCGQTGNLGAVLKLDSYRGEELNETNKDHVLMRILPFGSIHYPPREKPATKEQ